MNSIGCFKQFIASIALFLCIASFSYAVDKIHTECLFVLFDAGETNGLLPVLKRLDSEEKDFRVIVMATAETLIPPTLFHGKRLTLLDLDIQEFIDTKTIRTTELNDSSLRQLATRIDPALVLVGTASRIQQQALKCFPHAVKMAFVDNFNYDPQQENYSTFKEVQSVAQHVLCPSINVANMLSKGKEDHLPCYHVVGKPSIEQWSKELAIADLAAAFQASGLDPYGGPVVALIGGYGPGYEIINPLFDTCAEKLRAEGYQVIFQPHPKVAPPKMKTTDVLAIADFVVGYNSSVIFDAALLGKNVVYLAPKEIPFNHFAIQEGYLTSVQSIQELVDYLRSGKTPVDLKKELHIPSNSTEIILQLINNL